MNTLWVILKVFGQKCLDVMKIECRVAFLSEGARRAGWPDLGSREEGLVTSRRAGCDDRL